MKKNKKMIKSKTFPLIIIIISFLAFIGLILFAFKDVLFKAKPEDPKWGEVEEIGPMEDFEDVPEEDIEMNTVDGLTYIRRNLYNKGFSLMLPKDWEVNSTNPNLIYLKSKDPVFKEFEIAIYSQEIKNKNPNNLAINMSEFVAYNLKYHIHNRTLTPYEYDTRPYFYNLNYDENQTVWINKDDPLNYEQKETVPSAATGTWIKSPKFIDAYEAGDLELRQNSTVMNAYAYFTYKTNRNTEIIISLITPLNFQDKAKIVGDTIRNSIEPINSIKDFPLPSFNEENKIGNLSYKLPDYFNKHENSIYSKHYVSDDFRNKDFGIGFSAFIQDYNGYMEIPENINDLAYKTSMFNSLTDKKAQNIAYQNSSVINVGMSDFKDISKNNLKIEKGHTLLFLLDNNTEELLMKTETTFPINGITYHIFDKEHSWVYVLTITYGEGNKELAERYASRLERTFKMLK